MRPDLSNIRHLAVTLFLVLQHFLALICKCCVEQLYQPGIPLNAEASPASRYGGEGEIMSTYTLILLASLWHYELPSEIVCGECDRVYYERRPIEFVGSCIRKQCAA